MLFMLLGAWAWLNIPDAEGPGARFAYDTAVQRTGPVVVARLRYSAAIPGRNGTALVEALVEIDCVARTRRTLHEARGRSRFSTPNAARAPLIPASREGVLATLLCPAGPPARR